MTGKADHLLVNGGKLIQKEMDIKLMTSSIENKTPFLVRQITVKGRNNQELFNILQDAISKKPIQVIASPRIDVAGNAYYWLGVRFDRFELDFKLSVNPQIMDYIFSYLKGEENLPEVTDLAPFAPEMGLSQWVKEHERQHLTSFVKIKEELQMVDNKNYLTTKFVYRNGKLIYPSVEVEDILSLIGIIG